MTKTLQLTDKRTRDLLSDSIAKQAQISITHRFPDGWRQFRSAFVASLPDEGKILITTPVMQGDDAPNPPAVGSVLGISFRVGHKKCMFETTRVPHVGASDEAIAVRWPQELQQLQRRAYERAAPPQGSIVSVKFFRTAPEAATPARETRYGELEDLSAGGIRVNAANADGLTIGHTFECIFAPRPGSAPICCEVVLKHRESAERDRASLGFQFIGLETSNEGRETLTRLARIASEFQRASAPPPQKR
jgi:c-di-GMP-binding flagellar brake protein YcgR